MEEDRTHTFNVNNESVEAFADKHVVGFKEKREHNRGCSHSDLWFLTDEDGFLVQDMITNEQGNTIYPHPEDDQVYKLIIETKEETSVTRRNATVIHTFKLERYDDMHYKAFLEEILVEGFCPEAQKDNSKPAD